MLDIYSVAPAPPKAGAGESAPKAGPKLYIASGYGNASRVAELARVLTSHGWRHTYDWTVGRFEDSGAQSLAQIAENELFGVLSADLVVVLLPGLRGTHTEFGAALVAGKPVVLHAEDPAEFVPGPDSCPFYWADGVIRLVLPFNWLPAWLLRRYGPLGLRRSGRGVHVPAGTA